MTRELARSIANAADIRTDDLSRENSRQVRETRAYFDRLVKVMGLDLSDVPEEKRARTIIEEANAVPGGKPMSPVMEAAKAYGELACEYVHDKDDKGRGEMCGTIAKLALVVTEHKWDQMRSFDPRILWNLVKFGSSFEQDAADIAESIMPDSDVFQRIGMGDELTQLGFREKVRQKVSKTRREFVGPSKI